MIAAWLEDEENVASLRASWRAARIPAVQVPDAIDETAAVGLQTLLGAHGWRPFDVPDRGRYAFDDSYADAALFDELRAFAELVAERTLRLGPARWTRLRRGDYALVLDDARSRPEAATCVEVTLDFSEARTGEAQVVYVQSEQPVHTLAQRPRSLAVVERGPATFRYDRYLTHRVGAAEVYRLRLALL